METVVIPVIRIFDYEKAIEFYVQWLGFRIEWEHRFTDDAPIYMEISRGTIRLHLSEHHGDCSPGAKVFIEVKNGLKEYHQELIAKNYKYNKPGLQDAFWNAWSMEVNDPFNNKLLFSESKTP